MDCGSCCVPWPGWWKPCPKCVGSLVLSWCQTNDKVGQFRLPIKSANKNLICHAKIGRICLSPKSSDFIIYCLDEKIAQLPRMPSCDWPTNLWYRIHAVDMCSYTPKCADQLTLKQMHDQQISNQWRTHTIRFLCYFAVTIANNIEACAYLSSAIVVTLVTSEVTCVMVQRFHRPIFSGN